MSQCVKYALANRQILLLVSIGPDMKYSVTSDPYAFPFLKVYTHLHLLQYIYDIEIEKCLHLL